MNYEVKVYFLNDENEHIKKFKNKNNLIEYLIELNYIGSVEEISWRQI